MRNKWERYELLLCLGAYLKLPFFNGKVPTPSDLATLIPRNYASISIRLANFAACDPDAKKRGISGMAGGYAICKPYWDEFANNTTALQNEINKILNTNNTMQQDLQSNITTSEGAKFSKFELVLLLYLVIKRIPCEKGSHICDFFSLFFSRAEDEILYTISRFKKLIANRIDENVSKDLLYNVWLEYKSNSNALIYSAKLFWDFVLSKASDLYPEKTFLTSHILTGKLESIEADSDVENLVDILIEDNVSMMSIISNCMTQFGEKYSHMSLKEWKSIVSNYIQQFNNDSQSIKNDNSDSIDESYDVIKTGNNSTRDYVSFSEESSAVEEPKTESKLFRFSDGGKTIASSKCLDYAKKLNLPNFIDYREICRKQLIDLYNRRATLPTLRRISTQNVTQKDIEQAGKYIVSKWDIEFFISDRRKCVEDSGIVRSRQYIYYPIVDKIYLCDDVYTGLKQSIKYVLNSLMLSYSESDFSKDVPQSTPQQPTHTVMANHLSMKSIDVLRRTTEELQKFNGNIKVLNFNSFSLRDLGDRGVFKFGNAIVKIILVKGVIENSGIIRDTYYMLDTITGSVVSFGSITTARQRIESAIKRAYSFNWNQNNSSNAKIEIKPISQQHITNCNLENFTKFLSITVSSQGRKYSKSSVNVYSSGTRSNYMIKKVLRYHSSGSIFNITKIETAKQLLSDIELDFRNNKTSSSFVALTTLYIRFLQEYIYIDNSEPTIVDDAKNEQISDETISKKYIRVTYLDGTIDEQPKILNTLINFIKKVGSRNVYNLHLKYYGGDLVCYQDGFVAKYADRYHILDNSLYVNTNTNTQTKFNQMKEIALKLNYNCRIELMCGYTIIDSYNNM